MEHKQYIPVEGNKTNNKKSLVRHFVLHRTVGTGNIEQMKILLNHSRL